MLDNINNINKKQPVQQITFDDKTLSKEQKKAIADKFVHIIAGDEDNYPDVDNFSDKTSHSESLMDLDTVSMKLENHITLNYEYNGNIINGTSDVEDELSYKISSNLDKFKVIKGHQSQKSHYDFVIDGIAGHYDVNFYKSFKKGSNAFIALSSETPDIWDIKV